MTGEKVQAETLLLCPVFFIAQAITERGKGSIAPLMHIIIYLL